MSNSDIWKRLVIDLKKISKTLVKYLKWTYLVNGIKLQNDNVWEHFGWHIPRFYQVPD